MGLLDGLFSSEAVQNAAFGFLKKIVKDKGLEFITLRVDPDTDEIKIGMYKPGEAAIVVHAAPAETQLLIDRKPPKKNGRTDNRGK